MNNTIGAISNNRIKKPELLSPAGEFKTAIGAINAGADAVYLGAPEFSARAYAKNLSIDEIISVINYAHLNDCKVYLALNILLKNVEIENALNMVEPLYIHGLDGIIVQDLGFLMILREVFPSLELHASTQMAVLSSAGIELLKKYGVCRIVPGRELSIEEIKSMKNSGLELECFIHGAMCYSYSGRCLMSSIAGGRSGNRGRCAGPCRKCYSVDSYKEKKNSEKEYFLSMKDMCALPIFDQLIEAGVDSFKIEGRMKDSAYAAGVVSVYRKYIDNYFSDKKSELNLKKDLQFLSNLYIRSDIQEGYYRKHNGKDMITLSSPAYKGIEDSVKETIYKNYIDKNKKRQINAFVSVFANSPISLTLIDRNTNLEVTIEGEVVQIAQNKALTELDIQKQICKMGQTNFEIFEINVYTDENSFVSISELNAIRRKAVDTLLTSLYPLRKDSKLEVISLKEKILKEKILKNKSQESKITNLSVLNDDLQERKHEDNHCLNRIRVQIASIDQLYSALEEGFCEFVLPFYFEIDSIITLKESYPNIKLYVKLPDIIRENRLNLIEQRLKKLKIIPGISGIYCSSLDALSLAQRYFDKNEIIVDNGISVFNKFTEDFILSQCAIYTASCELNEKELNYFENKECRELIIYGRQEMMYSANCILKTKDKCDSKIKWTSIIDEDGRVFPVLPCHEDCYSITYNCKPLSLHNYIYKKIQNSKFNEFASFRLCFTNESKEEARKILTLYKNLFVYKQLDDVLFDYTNGHFKRGVE